MLEARREGRPRQPLYHSALEVVDDGTIWAIEMADVWSVRSTEHGVVAEGSVWASWLGRSRVFRYEVRCWPDGTIPDLSEAVGGPVRVSDDSATARRLLRLVPSVPPVVWGRDELSLGDMWNSNSLTSWLLAASGVNAAELHPPGQGRAPGWNAGLALAARQRHPIQAGSPRP